MGLTYVYGCVHTEVYVRHHDLRWVLTPNVCWRMVRDALAHVVWLRGEPHPTVPKPPTPTQLSCIVGNFFWAVRV